MRAEWFAASQRHREEATLRQAAVNLSHQRETARNRLAELEEGNARLRSLLQAAQDEALRAQQHAAPTESQHLTASSDMRHYLVDRDEQFVAQISSISAAVQALTVTVGSVRNTVRQVATTITRPSHSGSSLRRPAAPRWRRRPWGRYGGPDRAGPRRRRLRRRSHRLRQVAVTPLAVVAAPAALPTAALPATGATAATTMTKHPSPTTTNVPSRPTLRRSSTRLPRPPPVRRSAKQKP